MSAINQLKNLVVSFTGKLFGASKNNDRPVQVGQADEPTGKQSQKGVTSIIGTKNDYEASHQLSDFTIF